MSCTKRFIPPLPSTSASPEAISLQQALHESVFSPGISASPPHRVALCWDKHCQLLPEVLGLTAKRVAAWSAEEVRHAAAGAPALSRHEGNSVVQAGRIFIQRTPLVLVQPLDDSAADKHLLIKPACSTACLRIFYLFICFCFKSFVLFSLGCRICQRPPRMQRARCYI